MMLDHDARYAATLNEEEELLLAMKISAYECSQPHRRSSGRNTYTPTIAIVNDNVYDPLYPSQQLAYASQSSHSATPPHATVVEISAHWDDHDHHSTTASASLSSSLSPFYVSAMNDTLSNTNTTANHVGDTVHAEWIGSSSAATAATPPPDNHMIYASAAPATTVTTTSTSSTAIINEHHTDSFNDETYYEVAVIDSAPMEKQDETIGYTEEARIVDIREQQNDANSNTFDDDRKPAAIRRSPRRNSTSRQNMGVTDPPLPYGSNRQLPVIAEQQEIVPTQMTRNMTATAEVVSIQMENDLHPLLRTRSTENDSEAELVGLDHTFFSTTDVNTDDSSNTDRNYAVSDQQADIVAIQDEDAIHPSDLDALEMTRNNAASTTSAELVGTINVVNTDTPVANQYPTFFENDHPTVAIASSTCVDTAVIPSAISELEGDVVAIRDDDEVHPLEFDENAVLSAPNAELIGSVDPSIAFHEHLNHGSTSAVAMVMAVNTTESTADVVLAGSHIRDETTVEPIIMATAFTDPHQPLMETLPEDDDAPWGLNEDEEIARTLQEAEDIARTFQEDMHVAEILQDEDVARQLQDSSDSHPTVNTAQTQGDIGVVPTENAIPVDVIGSTIVELPIATPAHHVNEGNLSNVLSTPEPRQVDPTAREVSHDSTTSEHTASSQNLGNSVCVALHCDEF